MGDLAIFVSYLVVMLLLLPIGRLAWVEGYDSAAFATLSAMAFMSRLVLRWGVIVFTDETPATINTRYPGLVDTNVIVLTNVCLSLSILFAGVEMIEAHRTGTFRRGPRWIRRIVRNSWKVLRGGPSESPETGDNPPT